MVAESVLDSVRRYLQRLQEHGIRVAFGVIFGSQVTGRADAWSDIDLLVVSPTFDQLTDRGWVDLLWHVAAQTDSRIEPLPCGLQHWYSDTTSPLVEMARREGHRVTLT